MCVLGSSGFDSGAPESAHECSEAEGCRNSGAQRGKAESGPPESGEEVPEDAVLALRKLGWSRREAEKRVGRAWQRRREERSASGAEDTPPNDADLDPDEIAKLIAEAIRG